MREILLIEDCESDAQLTRRAMEIAGVQNPIGHLCNGAEAIARLESTAEPPSVIIVDLRLPDMSGFDLLARIHREPMFRNTVRVVLSQIGDLESVKKAYSLGAHSFLNKPVCQEELDELVKVFPTHWVLSAKGRTRSQVTADKQTFKTKRQTFQKLRADLETLRDQIENRSEALMIIDNILEDLQYRPR